MGPNFKNHAATELPVARVLMRLLAALEPRVRQARHWRERGARAGSEWEEYLMWLRKSYLVQALT